MPVTTDKRGYVSGKYGLELDGLASGFLESFEGGNATSDVVVEKAGADHIAHKHIAGVKYEDITVTCGTGMSQSFYEWIKATFHRNFTRQNGAIVSYDYNYKERSRLSFFNALITEIGLPALDASSKDTAKMTVKFTPEHTQHKKADGASSIAGKSSVQKRWLSSNFRLQITGLDCSRVNRIEAITATQKMVENPTGELRDYQMEPAYLNVSNLVVTLPESNAKEFYDWHESFVIKGDNGKDKEKNGTLEYLIPDLKEAFFTLDLKHLGIFRLAPEKVEAGAENIRRVRAEMYCEEITFSYGRHVRANADVTESATLGATQARAGQATTVAPAEQTARVLPSLRFRT